jgi:hypothetical protein
MGCAASAVRPVRDSLGILRDPLRVHDRGELEPEPEPGEHYEDDFQDDVDDASSEHGQFDPVDSTAARRKRRNDRASYQELPGVPGDLFAELFDDTPDLEPDPDSPPAGRRWGLRGLSSTLAAVGRRGGRLCGQADVGAGECRADGGAPRRARGHARLRPPRYYRRPQRLVRLLQPGRAPGGSGLGIKSANVWSTPRRALPSSATSASPAAPPPGPARRRRVHGARVPAGARLQQSRVDVYAFGVLLAELFAEQVPGSPRGPCRWAH